VPAAALLTMNLLVSAGLMETSLLKSEQAACAVRDAQAIEWKGQGLATFSSVVQGWCVAAVIRAGRYEAVQWREADGGSEGYHVRIPMHVATRPAAHHGMEFDLGIHGAQITVTPISSRLSLVLEHRNHIRQTYGGPRAHAESVEDSALEHPYAISRLSHRGQRVTVVSLRLTTGERFRVVLRHEAAK
jgi:hypothetical protein